MKKKIVIIALTAVSVAAMLAVGFGNSEVEATNVRSALPACGVALALEEGLDISEIYVEPTQAEEISQSIARNTSSNELLQVGVEEVLLMDMEVSNNETDYDEMPASDVVSAELPTESSYSLPTISPSSLGISRTLT